MVFGEKLDANHGLVRVRRSNLAYVIEPYEKSKAIRIQTLEHDHEDVIKTSNLIASIKKALGQ